MARTLRRSGGSAIGDETAGRVELVETEIPEPGLDEVVVEVYASALNPFEASDLAGAGPGRLETPRRGAREHAGHDLAGRVAEVGPGVLRFHVGDEVLGWVEDGVHGTHLVAPITQLVTKPRNLSWEVAGALSVAGTAAWKAVEQLELDGHDTVLVSDAAGGVGCLVAQLARAHGARVIGVADVERHDLLRRFEIEGVAGGHGLEQRLRELVPEGITGFVDVVGDGEALAARVGVARSRVVRLPEVPHASTTRPGRRATATDAATAAAERIALTRIVALFDAHRLQLPIADVYRLEDADEAYRALGRRETSGAVVLGIRTAGGRRREAAAT